MPSGRCECAAPCAPRLSALQQQRPSVCPRPAWGFPPPVLMCVGTELALNSPRVPHNPGLRSTPDSKELQFNPGPVLTGRGRDSGWSSAWSSALREPQGDSSTASSWWGEGCAGLLCISQPGLARCHVLLKRVMREGRSGVHSHPPLPDGTAGSPQTLRLSVPLRRGELGYVCCGQHTASRLFWNRRSISRPFFLPHTLIYTHPERVFLT